MMLDTNPKYVIVQHTNHLTYQHNIEQNRTFQLCFKYLQFITINKRTYMRE